jgi:hypothetical protein
MTDQSRNESDGAPRPKEYEPPVVEDLPVEDGPASVAAGVGVNGSKPGDFGLEWRP